VEKINDHGQRADGIVKGMLAHSRGKVGQRQPIDINNMLTEYTKLAYHGLRADDSTFNVSLDFQYDSAVGKIPIVAQDLSRAILNIVNNGCYSAHQKKKKLGDAFQPTISVSSRSHGDRIEIRIRDNGLGIPKEKVEKVFEPFYTTKPTGQGTGLGLSMTFDIIVQQHQGELRVESQEGEYAEFIIILPREPKQDGPAQTTGA
jgi:signal transduction histidine kinase